MNLSMIHRQAIHVILSLVNSEGERTMREAFELILADELATV